MASYNDKRFLAISDAEAKRTDEELKKLIRKYDRRMTEIEKEIQYQVNRMADENGVSNQKAHDMLKGKELEEFRWSVDDYIRYAEQNEGSREWDRQLQNASRKAKISRLEASKVHINAEIEKLYADVGKSHKTLSEDVYTDAYLRTAYTEQSELKQYSTFARPDTERIRKLASKGWAADGKNFSSRLWENRAKVAGIVESELTLSSIRGDSLETTVDNVMKKIEQAVPKSYVERLIRTESAYMTTAAQIQSFKDLGCDGVEFLATLDEVTCETCGPLDGIYFTFDDVKEGATVPPMHPNCRCCLSPWYTDDEPSGNRGARNPETGKWEDVPDMKYDDWKDIFVDKNKTLEDWLAENAGKSAVVKEEPTPELIKEQDVSQEDRFSEPEDELTAAKEELMSSKDENSVYARGLGKEKYNAVYDGIAERATNPNVVRMWAKHANDVNVISTDADENCFKEELNGIKMKAEFIRGNKLYYPHEIIVHETGHAVDYRLGGNKGYYSSTWKNGKFVKTVVKEVSELVIARENTLKPLYKEKDWDKLQKMGAVDEITLIDCWAQGIEPTYTRKAAYQSIKTEINNDYSGYHDTGCLMDILDGATYRKFGFDVGHKPKYWKDSEMVNGVNVNLGTEAFAEITECVLFNEGGLDAIKKYLPETYDTYIEMINEVK